MAERKFLIASIFITLGVIAVVSGYLLMSGDNSSRQTGALIERFTAKSVEINNTPLIVPLSPRKLVSFVNPFSDSEKIVAMDQNSNIIEINTKAKTEKILVNGEQKNMTDIQLSPKGDSVIYTLNGANNNKKYFYLDLKTGESLEIPGELKSAAFSPDDGRTAYLLNNKDGGEVLVSKGAKVVKQVIKTRLVAAMIDYPSDFMSLVSYDAKGYGDLFILKESGILNKIISYRPDLAVKWSPSGVKIIFSSKGGSDSDQLFYRSAAANEPDISLDVSVNASKCLWLNEDDVLCGIRNVSSFRDEFYKINTADGSKTLLLTPSINLFIKEMAVNRQGDTLFVLNDLDNKLYALKIK